MQKFFVEINMIDEETNFVEYFLCFDILRLIFSCVHNETTFSIEKPSPVSLPTPLQLTERKIKQIIHFSHFAIYFINSISHRQSSVEFN